MRLHNRALHRVFVHLCALLIALMVLVPFYWLVVSSISTNADLMARPPNWFPQEPTVGHYRDIFAQLLGEGSGMTQAEQIVPALRNSLVIAGWVTALNLLFGSLAGYAFARFKFPFRKSLLFGLLAGRMLPVFAIILPFFVLFRQIGLNDTITGVVIAHTGMTLPFSIWLMRGFFSQIPVDMEWAARVDGCSRTGAMVRIAFPLAIPGMIAAGLFSFMMSWNEFPLVLVLTETSQATTVQPAIASLWSQTRVDYGVMMAGALLAAIPPILIALTLQRYLVTGLTSGGAKG